MHVFFERAPDWVLVPYWVAVAVVIAYLARKFARRGYVVSPYTIVVCTFAFTLLVVGPFQYNDQAWLALGRSYAAAFWPYLDISMAVNALGFSIVVLTMWMVEGRATPRKSPPLVSRPPFIAVPVVAATLVLGMLVFTACLAVIGTIPLFGNRTAFNAAPALRPVYNFANYTIQFTTSVLVVWSFIARSRRYAVLILAGLACMLLTGGRTPLLATVELILVMWLYGRFRGNTRRATVALVIGLAGVAIGGLWLSSFRQGGDFNLAHAAESALYANTFSDIRDGAYVLSAWDWRLSNAPLGGTTYLAGLMSFIPSSVSDFRESWSWGYFTTSTLFGYSDHYGFRGGWSLEMFMNFGVAGIVLGALACGWLLGRLEALFRIGVVEDAGRWYPTAYVWSWVGFGVFSVLIASSGTYNLYSLVLILALLRFMTLVRQGLHFSIGIDRRGMRNLSVPMMGYDTADLGIPLPRRSGR